MPSLPILIERACRRFANSVAASDDSRAITFRELEDRTARLANGLRARAGREARIALLMGNRAEYVEADVAIVRAGLTKLPLNPQLAASEHRYILEDAAASIVITDADHAQFALDTQAEVDFLERVLIVGAGGDYEQFLSLGSPRSPQVRPRPSDPSNILYTSGTTGRPKGAVSSYGGRLAGLIAMLTDELSVDPGDTMAHVAPLSHGSGSKVLAYLVSGANNRALNGFDAEAFLSLAAAREVTSSFMVPTMIQRLVEAYNGQDISSLKHITYGGSPIAPARIREALEVFGPVFVQVYGSCEAPHPVTVLPALAHREFFEDDDVLGSAGCAATMTEIELVDEEGQAVEDGVAGEVIIRSPSLMAGYWGNPDATAEVLKASGYRTGDVGRRDSRGFLTIIDRKREMVISGGLNVYPAEVENNLLSHRDVAEVAVIGVPDDHWGEMVKAFVVRRPGSSVSAQELIEHCRSTLASYKKPRQIEFVAALPKGSTGKLLKRELRESAWGERERQVN